METLLLIINSQKFQTAIFDVFLNLIYIIIIAYIVYKIYVWQKHSNFINEEGLHCYWESGSLPSPSRKKYIDGYRWSTPQDLISQNYKNKDAKFKFVLNEFKYEDDYSENIKLPKSIKEKNEKLEVVIDSRDLAKGLVLVAGAGSGKTVIMKSWMEQIISKRQVFFSMKGEFEALYYRPGIDFLLHVTHPQGTIHDILSEDISYIKLYVDTLLQGTVGKETNFFVSSSKQMIEGWLQRIKVKDTDDNLTIKEKWEEFILLIESEIEKVNESKQSSKKDVMSTAATVISMLRLSAFRIINGSRTFTVKQFVQKENVKLFLSATEPENIPFLAASFAVLIKYMLSLPNIEDYDNDNLTTLYLDEYLSLTRCIDADLLNSITELGRSKGLIKLCAVQKLGDDEKEISSLLTNVEYIIIGSTTDMKSINALQKLVGEVTYNFEKKSYQNKGKKSESVSTSTEIKKKQVLSDYLMKTIRNQEFGTITFVPKQAILYLSKNEYIPEVLRDFKTNESIDMTEFYRYKIELEDKQEKQAKENKKPIIGGASASFNDRKIRD